MSCHDHYKATIRELEESEVAAWSYSLTFKHTGGGIRKNEVTIIQERVCQQGQVILDRSEQSEGEDEVTLKYTHLEQPTVNKSFRELKNFFDNIEYLNIVPQLVRESDSIMLTIGKEDYFGRNLIQRIARLNDPTRFAYLRQINNILRLAVPQMTNLSLVKDEMGIPHLEATYQHWRARGSKQQEHQFSDGTLRLIGFIFALLDSKGLTLLEEPESNLHTAIVAQLPEFIAKIQRTKAEDRQVILTTHSYDILSNEGIAGNEVVLLCPTAEGTEVRSINDIDTIKAALDAGFTVADTVIPYSKPEGVEAINSTID